jgi:FRG domain
VKIASADSLSEFLGTIERLRQEWKTDDEDLRFRGERKAYGSSRLRPKLYRGRASEGRTLGDLLEYEAALFGDFRRCGGPLCEHLPEDDWEWYFLMQHYGGPTRLLDWSDGSLMALHFAIRDYPSASGDALVYALDAGWLADRLDDRSDYDHAERSWKKFCKNHPSGDREEWVEIYLPQEEDEREEIPLPKIPMLWDPPHVTRRFAAQRSRFMIFGSDQSWLSNLADERRNKLCAIAIEEARIHQIKGQLRRAGVAESVIFPDLDGLGREQGQLWEDSRPSKK